MGGDDPPSGISRPNNSHKEISEPLQEEADEEEETAPSSYADTVLTDKEDLTNKNDIRPDPEGITIGFPAARLAYASRKKVHKAHPLLPHTASARQRYMAHKKGNGTQEEQEQKEELQDEIAEEENEASDGGDVESASPIAAAATAMGSGPLKAAAQEAP